MNDQASRDATPVVILGAGVAGSTLATLLAREGRPVSLVGSPPDASGPRIGESLPGFAARWLQERALPGPLSRGSPHWPVPGSLTAWNGEVVAQSFVSRPWGAHFRLDRPAFDRDLYRAARQSGPRVHPPLASAVTPGRHGWQVVLDSGEELDAAWLVDATGRRAWATRRFRAAQDREGAQVALWGVGAETARADRRTVTETAAEGWWYGCLLPGGHPLACLHCRKLIARDLIAEAELWHKALSATTILRSVVDPHDFAGVVPRLANARGVFRRPLVGETWIAIGDAAVAFDPIASHGISFALYSSNLALEWLRGGEGADFAEFCENQWRADSLNRSVFYETA